MTIRLSPTSFALLGLLNLKPFSAYELTKYMQGSALTQLWPRAKASIYREPKNLVEHGLATSHTEQQSRRRRTVYEITPAGRDALEVWLREPGTGLRFECEAALKTFFGDAADLATLRNQLRVLVDVRKAQLEAAKVIVPMWLEGEISFPDRLQYSAMAADLSARLYFAVGEWAQDWLDRTKSWETTALHDESARQADEFLKELVRESED